MICSNCGFQNAAGDTFCGSCGKFLEWSGQPAAGEPGSTETSGAAAGGPPPAPPSVPTQGGGPPPPPSPPPSPLDDTAVTPIVPPLSMGTRSRAQAVPTGSTQRAPAPIRPSSNIVCWNCGRTNPASRSFCQQCGEKLTVAAAGQPMTAGQREPGGGGRRTLAIGAAVLAVLLLAGGAAAFLFNLGGAPSAPPTLVAVVTPSPAALPTIGDTPAPTLPPTIAPATDAPATFAPPTDAPPATAPPATPPPATAPPATSPPVAINCQGSQVETGWINLTRDDPRHRLPQDSFWCVHQVFIVPHFGFGRIRLMVGDTEIFGVNHEESTAQPEYSRQFRRPFLIFPGSRARYVFDCHGPDCSALIQVGYDQISVP